MRGYKIRSEPVSWSEEKQQSLQEQLTGFWASDEWTFTTRAKLKGKPVSQQRFMKLGGIPPLLKVEIKYALRRLCDFDLKCINSRGRLCTDMNKIAAWLAQISPKERSLLERSSDEWELSLRSYLVKNGRYRERKTATISATQDVVEYVSIDSSLGRFRQLYLIIRDTYDDRSETDKDIWDLGKMGLELNPTTHHDRSINFTLITQPWLRQLAKQFMAYRTCIVSAGDCTHKFQAIRNFSNFLLDYRRVSQASQIDRTCIVDYIRYLQEHKFPNQRIRMLLINLRVFF